MKSRSNNTIFDSVPVHRPSVSSFDLSHNKILSLDMGKLVPTLGLEVLPGDKFNINSENFLRLAPLVSPVMHQINVKTYTFFVPTRILWAEFPKWITKDSTAEAPYITGLTVAGGWSTGSLADYFDIPASSAGFTTQKISPMIFAAYLKCYDEYFRQQDLVTEKFEPLVAGDNSTNYLSVATGQPVRKAWEHDYFTSCLPWAQKGDSVQLPLIDGTGTVQQIPWGGIPQAYPHFTLADGTTSTIIDGLAGNANSVYKDSNSAQLSYNPAGTLQVDVNSDAVTINTLRRAFAVQKWLETNARGGTRYTEHNLAHFGVKSSDSRLQRPEYLGSSAQTMRISEVMSTAQTVDQASNDVPVGAYAGSGISIGASKGINYTAEEHGYIITMMCVLPKTSYYQGLHRMHQRFDPLDYATPLLANIGEQEVYVKELRNDVGTSDDLNEVFGYIPRYSEYKFHHSGISGDMRGDATLPLDHFHMARTWTLDDLPALNEEFIEAKPDKRIFAVTDDTIHSIYAQVFHNIRAVRKLPKYGVPSL